VKFGDGTVMGVFYEAGSVGEVSVDRACVVMVREGRIFAGDAMGEGGEVRVKVGGKETGVKFE
jgi:hypothetical protein